MQNQSEYFSSFNFDSKVFDEFYLDDLNQLNYNDLYFKVDQNQNATALNPSYLNSYSLELGVAQTNFQSSPNSFSQDNFFSGDQITSISSQDQLFKHQTPIFAEPKCEILPKEENVNALIEKSNKERPPLPYPSLIAKAIISNQNNSMQLQDIYEYMIEK